MDWAKLNRLLVWVSSWNLAEMELKAFGVAAIRAMMAPPRITHQYRTCNRSMTEDGVPAIGEGEYSGGEWTVVAREDP